jgi:DNA-directed RNA polymerase specialized sigma24 family protein
VDDYTQAEIAAMLDVPPGTVASWLSRAKAQLREALADA